MAHDDVVNALRGEAAVNEARQIWIDDDHARRRRRNTVTLALILVLVLILAAVLEIAWAAVRAGG